MVNLAAMPLSPPQKNRLLYYNSDYKVLICLKCRYAIQKNAIASHLLRHKIYRGDRQKLLAQIAKLDLLEPESVPLPPPGSQPIEGLDTQTGYRCKLDGCQALTVSTKRMKRHWNEVHGHSRSVPSFDEYICPANLQSFFRGTKIKYFEVDTVNNQVTSRHDCHSDGASNRGDQSEHEHEIWLDIMAPDLVPSGHASSKRVPQSSKLSEDDIAFPLVDIDMGTLRYFHHFVTIILPTLPGSSHSRQTIVSKALEQPGLMCGLLAISTCHLMCRETRQSTVLAIHSQQSKFSREFNRFLERYTDTPVEQGPSTPCMQKPNLDQFSALLKCAEWAAAQKTCPNDSKNTPPRLEIILETLRQFHALESQHSDTDVQNPDVQFELANFGLPESRSGASDCSKDSSPFMVLERLQRLPYRMVQVLERPEKAEDVTTVLSAIDALITCVNISFVSNDIEVLWSSVSLWLRMTQRQPHFNELLRRHEPGAMIVVAHWAALLLQRLEHLGCWYLKGVARKIVAEAVGHLSVAHAAAVCLVSDLT